MGVLKTRMPLPIWASGQVPTRGFPRDAPADAFPERTGDDRLQIRSDYQLVEHSLDATGPGADLMRQAIDFRAMYGEWGLTNVAVIEYRLEGSDEVHVLIAVSDKNAHSETRALQYLRSLEGVTVTRLYTEREPCEGTAGHHCAGALLNDPITKDAQIFATWPYPDDPDVNTVVKKDMTQHLKGLKDTPGLQDAAVERSLESDALHVLPIHGSFPFVEDAAKRAFPEDLAGKIDGGSATFRARDVARALSDEKS